MNEPEDVERRFQEALDLFVAKVREDRYVLAAILIMPGMELTRAHPELGDYNRGMAGPSRLAP